MAELLGISLRTYYTMVSRGKLHPVKHSERVTVVARKEIFSMIETALGETLSQSIFSKDKRKDVQVFKDFTTGIVAYHLKRWLKTAGITIRGCSHPICQD